MVLLPLNNDRVWETIEDILQAITHFLALPGKLKLSSLLHLIKVVIKREEQSYFNHDGCCLILELFSIVMRHKPNVGDIVDCHR